MNRIVSLPGPVAAIYRVEAPSKMYPGRPFTPDGHLVGSIGEVVAAEALGLTLYPPSQPGHDAYDADGDVQIKMTAGNSVSMYATCDRLVVLTVINAEQAEIVYDGSGAVRGTVLAPVRRPIAPPSSGSLQAKRQPQLSLTVASRRQPKGDCLIGGSG